MLLIYFVLPKKIRYLWLLAASYYFYACWNAKYALLMLFSTAVTYASGLLIAASHRRGKPGQKKLWVALSFLINLGILAVFKYGGFFAENVNALFASLGLSGRVNAPGRAAARGHLLLHLPGAELHDGHLSRADRCGAATFSFTRSMFPSSRSSSPAPSNGPSSCCRKSSAAHVQS